MAPTQLIPGPDHPIAVEPSTEHVVVRAGGTVIADSRSALVLREASYSPVHYLPRADLDANVLRPSSTTTHCPYKGDASYLSVVTADGEVADAMWSYENPYDAVAQIKGYVAFYPDRVDMTIG